MGEVAVPRALCSKDFAGGQYSLTVGRDPDAASRWIQLRAGVHGPTSAGRAGDPTL
jgi:hypothetical protein